MAEKVVDITNIGVPFWILKVPKYLNEVWKRELDNRPQEAVLCVGECLEYDMLNEQGETDVLKYLHNDPAIITRAREQGEPIPNVSFEVTKVVSHENNSRLVQWFSRGELLVKTVKKYMFRNLDCWVGLMGGVKTVDKPP